MARLEVTVSGICKGHPAAFAALVDGLQEANSVFPRIRRSDAPGRPLRSRWTSSPVSSALENGNTAVLPFNELTAYSSSAFNSVNATGECVVNMHWPDSLTSFLAAETLGACHLHRAGRHRLCPSRSLGRTRRTRDRLRAQRGIRRRLPRSRSDWTHQTR